MSHVSISLETAGEICQVFDRLFETFSGTVSLKSVLEHGHENDSVVEVAKQINKLCSAFNDEANKTTDIREQAMNIREHAMTLDKDELVGLLVETQLRLNNEKEEREGLVDSLSEIMVDFGYDKELQVDDVFYRALKENKELKEPKQGLKPINDIVKEFEGQYQEYEKEIKALKEENEFTHLMATEGARKGIEKSKEITKLKSQIECLEKCSLSQDIMEESGCESIEEFENDIRDNWRELQQQNETIIELQEEIKILKSYNHKLFEGEGGVRG